MPLRSPALPQAFLTTVPELVGDRAFPRNYTRDLTDPAGPSSSTPPRRRCGPR
ncbi:hypothetical protein [Actinoplanes palleronii]|uniref:hypothetical protein n=1 Tax=Actinoplanes palleronii TaxID=113570 RepID=UPI001940BB65|nr:hypothetical protein [Actinoplanes palleronii]